jgi:hypothetical protein
MSMPHKPTVFDLMLLSSDGSKKHLQKVLRSLLASERAGWTRLASAKRLRRVAAAVFAAPDAQDAAPTTTRLPPMRLGGRFAPDTALDE